MPKLLETVLIGGGTGFIGSALTNVLLAKGYGVTIVSRMPGPQSISWNDLANHGLPENVSAVVNLAGQNVLDPTRRWTPGFQQNVWSSRVNTTASLAQAIIKAAKKPNVFVTISGVGIYEPSTSTEYDEDVQLTSFDYLSKLCHKWEAAAELPEDVGVRQVTVRSGVVLGKYGGMIRQLYVPFFMGLGGPIASGKQYMPWIHISDMANLLAFAIENDKVRGILNGVAPQIVTNKEFTDAFAKALWRPAVIPLPEFAVKLAFGEERAKMMTEGQKVIPKRVLDYGFVYEYPDISSALAEIVTQ